MTKTWVKKKSKLMLNKVVKDITMKKKSLTLLNCIPNLQKLVQSAGVFASNNNQTNDTHTL